MQKRTRVALACSTTLLLAGCAKSDKAATDSAAAAAAAAAATPAPAPPPPAPAALALADVAGKWKMTSRPGSGTDTTATLVTLTATADTTGWMMTMPNGAKVPLHVTASGDSVVTVSDVYSSARRKGVKVHTVSTMRMQNGGLSGTTVAHYVTKGPDSVLVLHSEAVKQP
jgi:glucose/arabinose dehydrogenase